MSKINIVDSLRDKERRWLISIGVSYVVLFAFIIYNGYLGICKHSIWNGSICIYYILLSLIKGLILINEVKLKNKSNQTKQISRKRMFYASSILLFLINISLFVPITLMVLNKKNVEFDMIVGITIATYTTYKVTIAILYYIKNRHNKNLAFRQIRTINLIDAILSILTLQNTLIAINGTDKFDIMFPLSVISSFVGIVAIITISIVTLVRGAKENKKI